VKSQKRGGREAHLHIFDSRVEFGIQEQDVLETRLALSFSLKKEMEIRICSDHIFLDAIDHQGVRPIPTAGRESQKRSAWKWEEDNQPCPGGDVAIDVERMVAHGLESDWI
jgi:hypothetical protein